MRKFLEPAANRSKYLLEPAARAPSPPLQAQRGQSRREPLDPSLDDRRRAKDAVERDGESVASFLRLPIDPREADGATGKSTGEESGVPAAVFAVGARPPSSERPLAPATGLVEKFDIEPYSDFSAK